MDNVIQELKQKLNAQKQEEQPLKNTNVESKDEEYSMIPFDDNDNNNNTNSSVYNPVVSSIIPPIQEDQEKKPENVNPFDIPIEELKKMDANEQIKEGDEKKPEMVNPFDIPIEELKEMDEQGKEDQGETEYSEIVPSTPQSVKEENISVTPSPSIPQETPPPVPEETEYSEIVPSTPLPLPVPEQNNVNPPPGQEELTGQQDSVNRTGQLTEDHNSPTTEYSEVVPSTPVPVPEVQQSVPEETEYSEIVPLTPVSVPEVQQSVPEEIESITPSSLTQEQEQEKENNNNNPFSNIISSLTGEQQEQPTSSNMVSNMPVNISNSFQEIIDYTADQIVNRLSTSMNLSLTNNKTLQNGFVSNNLNANTIGSEVFNGGKRSRRSHKKSKKYTRRH